VAAEIRVIARDLGCTAAFLAGAAEAVRSQFGGPLTYAAGTWEPVDWSRIDIVSVDAYRDARNAGRAPGELTFPVQRLLRQY